MTTITKLLKFLGSHLIPAGTRLLLFRAAFALMPLDQKDKVRRFFHIASLDTSLRNMKRLGFNPVTIVDVGAYEGNWTLLIKNLFPDSKVLMIEAQPEKDAILQSVKLRFPQDVIYDIAVLGAEDGKEIVFFELETGSSVLEENSEVPRLAHKRKLATLETVLDQNGWKTVDFLKLDVQGYELEVLKGAERILPSIEVILLEVSFLQVNHGAPLLAEVVEFMQRHSFRAYEVCSFIRRPLDNALWQSDILFVNEKSDLVANSRFAATEVM